MVLYFRRSEHMEAASGLATTLTMLMTTILLTFYLFLRSTSLVAVWVFLGLNLTQEGSFLVANMRKFPLGDWVSLAIGGLVVTLMYLWQRSFTIRRRLTEFTKIDRYLPQLKELSKDVSIPKYATHLVFMNSASRNQDIEDKIIYSIFQKRPKRADVYWFLHVDFTDEPFTLEYKVVRLEEDVIRVNFRLGFRVEQRISLFFRIVVEDMVRNQEVNINSRYESLSRQNITGDFRFVVLEKYLSADNYLPLGEKIIMVTYFFIKQFTSPEAKWFRLDTSSVKVEKVLLLIRPVRVIELTRVG